MKKLLLLILAGLSSVSALAQSDLMLYNFDAVVQSLEVNPALKQQTRFYIGIPALTGVEAYYHNSGFKPVDLLATGTDVNANMDKIVAGLDTKSQIAFNTQIDLLGVGFRTKKGFLTFGAYQSADFKMDYPADLIKLVWFGNAPQEYRSADLNDFSFEVINRTNYYIGYQQNVTEKLRLGGRFKYIIGQNHSYIERMNASITTSDQSGINIKTDILVRTAGVSNWLDDSTSSGNSFRFFPKNNGFALDLGANYQINEKWSASLSVLDLGFITWKSNNREYSSKGEFEYDGLNADLSQDKPVESFDNIADSLKEAFDFKKTDGVAYTKWLSSRIFAGAEYQLNDKNSIGALYHARLWEGRAYSDFSLSYNGRLAPWIQYGLSYSIIDHTYNNIGAGISLKGGPIQFYIMSDNFVHAIMYENLQSTNVRVGLNIALYAKKEKKNKPSENPENISTP